MFIGAFARVSVVSVTSTRRDVSGRSRSVRGRATAATAAPSSNTNRTLEIIRPADRRYDDRAQRRKVRTGRTDGWMSGRMDTGAVEDNAWSVFHWKRRVGQSHPRRRRIYRLSCTLLDGFHLPQPSSSDRDPLGVDLARIQGVGLCGVDL